MKDVPTSPAALLPGHARHGHGPIRVLVLHDWLCDHSSYDALLPHLDTQAFSYVLMDLRGYGRSRGLPLGCSVQQIAADCIALADHLGWQRFHVIGHSMTGMLTQRLAVDIPGRLLGAVALRPVSAAGNRLPADMQAFFASTVHDDDALARLLAHVSGGMPASWVAARVRRHRAVVEAEAALGYLRMLVETDFSGEMRDVATRFLVVVGDRDPRLDAEAMTRTFLAWHPEAVLAVINECGHFPMAQHPARLAAIIEAFMRQHPA
ncbi:MAG: Dihydrolipoyllysine-residue acetyltransferase component of acetoin cleaving system [Stenotrophomonas maltophilia]|uniref:Dihydrolipoyllysine-residue acetyltransferase component of acetoin cleaving system n=1 Tax=Stenotrophomonas maltophilia TaxID=40324 RepID=A0A7V8FJ91_STEMA|nr:MAG: Dihydrolipoyllysine-residue acetyltransferase component of acetoin cleaving system [Stenotrophomonas maltophilia]